MTEDAESPPSETDDSELGDNLGDIWSDGDTGEQDGSLESDFTLDESSAFETPDSDFDLTSDEFADQLEQGSEAAVRLAGLYDESDYWDTDKIPVRKGLYTLEHYKIENYYTDYDPETREGERPTAGDGRFGDEDANEDGIIPFNPEEHVGFDPEKIEERLAVTDDQGQELESFIEENTVNTQDDFEEDEFFTTYDGYETITTRYDLEKTVPDHQKRHFIEEERYWVNKPFAFIVIFRSQKENERKYYVVEPHQTEVEQETIDFLLERVRSSIKYDHGSEIDDAETDVERAKVVEDEVVDLLQRFKIYEVEGQSLTDKVRTLLTDLKQMFKSGDMHLSLDSISPNGEKGSPLSAQMEVNDDGEREEIYLRPRNLEELEGSSIRPEPVLEEEDSDTLTEYQVRKLLYYLKRDFVGFEKIDPIKNDINVEDISVDGYNEPVFVYHTDYEQIISNVFHGEEDLDNFVTKLAQRSGKSISKSQPQVDATLPDGSRSQLTLGDEVSDHGTNYTIRQFKDVPFTPIDLINWHTFGLDEMAFLWLAIENNKSLIFAGGTASGKTTSLNAVSLFIPSNAKIVSIEDTREVELPQRNWIASVTRPSFSEDGSGGIDEFDLLEAALRQRPDYIVMGEIRGEEGRTLFQVMSTGHTTYTTFHADSVDEVLKRFTTKPINVSKTLFTALDLVSIQTQTRIGGSKVRRNKTLTEVNDYNAENDEINVKDVYQWQPETDSFREMEGASTLGEIKFDRGWTDEELRTELLKRKAVLAYLIKNRLNEYAQVAATIQAFINDPESILSLMAAGRLEDSLDDLRQMESVQIDIDQEKEDMVPRPEPDRETENQVDEVLDRAQQTIFQNVPDPSEIDLASAIVDEEQATSTTADSPDDNDSVGIFEGDSDGSDVEADNEDMGFLTGGGSDDPFADDDDESEIPDSWLESDEDDDDEDVEDELTLEEDAFDFGGD